MVYGIPNKTDVFIHNIDYKDPIMNPLSVFALSPIEPIIITIMIRLDNNEDFVFDIIDNNQQVIPDIDVSELYLMKDHIYRIILGSHNIFATILDNTNEEETQTVVDDGKYYYVNNLNYIKETIITFDESHVIEKKDQFFDIQVGLINDNIKLDLSLLYGKITDQQLQKTIDSENYINTYDPIKETDNNHLKILNVQRDTYYGSMSLKTNRSLTNQIFSLQFGGSDSNSNNTNICFTKIQNNRLFDMSVEESSYLYEDDTYTLINKNVIIENIEHKDNQLYLKCNERLTNIVDRKIHISIYGIKETNNQYVKLFELEDFEICELSHHQ